VGFRPLNESNPTKFSIADFSQPGKGLELDHGRKKMRHPKTELRRRL